MTISSDDRQSYESVLAAEDTRNRRIQVIFGLVGAVGLSLYFRTAHVYGLLAVLVMWRIVSDFLGGRRTVAMGYEVRGTAQSRGAIEWLICLLVLGAAFFIQSEFSLWFAQEPLCRRCT